MSDTAKEIVVFTDGGARGNPGPAGIGVAMYLYDPASGEPNPENMTLIKKVGKYIGESTNNFAEYTALITALQEVSEMEAERVRCILDSELVVKQLNGQYKIKEPTLQTLAQKVILLANKFKSVSYTHVRREKNKLADQLVNEAIDNQIKASAQ